MSRIAFQYYGGKSRLASRIADMLPVHNAWVEAFCGSAAVTLAKEPAPIEVLNDIHSEIVNVFRQIRDNPDELVRLVDFTPYSREENILSKRDDAGISDLERARRFLVNANTTYRGVLDATSFYYSFAQSRGGTELHNNKWHNRVKRIAEIAYRLKHAVIEHKDGRVVVDNFANRPASLIYVDPPYVGEDPRGYIHGAHDEEFHVDLLTRCKAAKAMVLISSYPSELYSDMLTAADGWTSTSFNAWTANNKGEYFDRTEVLWMNECFNETKKAGKVLLELTEAEANRKNINPPR